MCFLLPWVYCCMNGINSPQTPRELFERKGRGKVFLQSLEKTGATGGFDGLLDARVEFGVGCEAGESFDGGEGFAIFSLDHGDEEICGLGKTSEGDGAQQDAGEPRFRGALVAVEQAGKCLRAAGLGQGKGGFGGGGFGAIEEICDEGDGGVALDVEEGVEAGGEHFFGFFAGKAGAEAEEGRGDFAELGEGADGFDANGFVFVYERIYKQDKELLVVEAIAGNESVGAIGAESAGGVGFSAPNGLHLMVAKAANESFFVATFEFREGAAESVLGPALGVGFFGVDEETIEGGEEVGEQIYEVFVFGETRSFGDDEVVAVGKGFLDQGESVGVESAVLEAVERFQLFVKSALRHGLSLIEFWFETSLAELAADQSVDRQLAETSGDSLRRRTCRHER